MKYFYALGSLVLIATMVAAWFLMQSATEATITFSGEMPTQFTPEMFSGDRERLETIEQNFEGARGFFVDVAKRSGAVYAFALLKIADLPPGTDLHLMGHAVGDELYKQIGLDGMQYCTHDFRNACSHSVVIGALLAEGADVFDKVNDVCKLAPGGIGAYTMCFHGFGHGVLAYADYEIPEAVALCEKIGTEAYGNEEASQCIGGMVMEMHQGIHDPEVWAEKKGKHLDPNDPLKLCKADYMPEHAKVLCYSYITPYIFDAAGAVGGAPTPEIYPESFAYCDEVADDRYRQACYGGLGKEFIVLSQDRDIRKIEETDNEHLVRAASWCSLAEREEAKRACHLSLLDSLYWGGENDPEVSVRFCALVDDTKVQAACFTHLFGITEFYQKDPIVRERICALVPETFATECLQVLHIR